MSEMKRNENGQFVSVDKVEVECPQCGDTHKQYPSDAERGRKFCSKECSAEYKSDNLQGESHHNYEREATDCEYCGEAFEHLPSKDREYCSGECRNKDRDYPTGEDNPNWKGGKTPLLKRIRNTSKYDKWRTAVFERDNYTCQDCGTSDKYLNAHHKVPLSENLLLAYDVENGVTLCVDCHQKRHPDTRLNLSQSAKNAGFE